MQKIFGTFNSAGGDTPRKEPRGRRQMNMLKAACALLALMTSSYSAMPASAADSGKVLVILSSASQLELRDGKTPGLQHPKTLSAILKQGTADYVGVFIPGGHAPLQDLVQEKTLGDILVTFHATARPTGLICHGPTALLSTVSDPVAFRKAMVAGDFTAASKLAAGWPYAGYRLTVFSSGEEHAIEGQGNQLGGSVQFYAADALAQAGAHVDRIGAWGVNVVEDRELVSGQQPFSSDAFGDAFVAKLKAARGM